MLGTIRPARDDPAAPGPFDRLRPRVLVALAAALFSTTGSVFAARNQGWTDEPGLVGLLLLLVAPAALVLLLPRRPALATTAAVAATLAFLLLRFPWGPVFIGPVAVLVGVMLSGPVRRARLVAWSGAALLAGAGRPSPCWSHRTPSSTSGTTRRRGSRTGVRPDRASTGRAGPTTAPGS
nr:hypothetical protein GCM10025730_30370 [Promicromonospora thailandica]